MTLPGFVAQCLHVLLMLLAAPTVVGVLDWAEARLAGQSGRSWRAPWHELSRLRRKQPVVVESGSAVSGFAPLLCFAALSVAAMLVPSFALGMSLAPFADLLVIAGLLILARIAMALAALDEGTASGAIAARQSLAMALLGDVALLLAILALGLAGGTTNLDLLAELVRTGMLLPHAALVLVAGVFAVLALTQRDFGMPEAAGFAGPDLALCRFAEALRLLVWIDLIGAAFVPFGMAPASDFPGGWSVGLLSWAARIVVALGLLAGVRVIAGRIAWRRVPALLLVWLLLAVLASLLVVSRARPV